MSEVELQRLSRSLEKAENAARIRLFGKAASQFNNLIKAAESVQPDLQEGFRFLSMLYTVNHDISQNKDPIVTGTMRELTNIAPSISNQSLTMALPGGVFGEFYTDRVFSETRGLLMMSQGVRDKDIGVLEHAINHFLQIGKEPLFFSRYVNVFGRRITGNRAALECEARKEVVRASQFEDANPNAAIPHYMLATRALRAARRYEEEKEFRQTLMGLRMVRPCWFCGRLVQGANHFRIMPSVVTPYFENLLRENKEDLRVLDGQDIHACIPCASAVAKEADRIVTHYVDQLLKRIDTLATQIAVIQQTLIQRGLLKGGV